MMAAGRNAGTTRPSSGLGGEVIAIGLAVLLLWPSMCCYLAGGLGALVAHGRFASAPAGVVATLAIEIGRHPGNPALAWPAATRRLVPGPYVVEPLAVLFLGGSVALGLWAASRRGGRKRHAGFATATEVRASLSERSVREKAPQVRPTLNARRSEARELGLSLGRDVASRTALWASLEDSFLVLGPPRSGKGVSLVIPGVLDAPGAAIVTSNRPDVLRHTAGARADPVVVFDPQDSTGWARRLRWSPVAGCEDPLTAILRGRGFAAGAGFERSTTDADFWMSSAAAVIRAYLHAAALDGRSIIDVISWAARPTDSEPIRILRSAPDAAPGWADDLSSQAATDPRTRDGIWAGVRRAFDCFADPRVLAACSPAPKEAFDPDAFLAAKGTLYVVGSTGAQLSVAPLITAMIEDLAERALNLAARSKHGRLDPPLALFLDEVANIAPLTSLPTLLSSGGGSGICTLSVLQSLAQARARWGQDRADAIWDASTVRIVLGGLGHADDLTRISRLAGEIDEEVGSASRGAGGQTWSTSLRSRPVLPLERIRSLAAGRALVLHRRTPPIEAALLPWWERPCAQAVRASLARVGDPASGDGSERGDTDAGLLSEAKQG